MKREIIHESLEVKAHGELQSTHVEIAVRYEDGSMTGRRGYYLSINPVKVEGRFQTYVAYTGARMHLEDAKVYNKTRHAKVAGNIAAEVRHLLSRVLREHKLEVVSPSVYGFDNYRPEVSDAA